MHPPVLEVIFSLDIGAFGLSLRRTPLDLRLKGSKFSWGRRVKRVCVWCVSHLQPCGLQLTRFLCPWTSPCKNTGVGCHALLQGSSWPRDQTLVSCIAGGFWATRAGQQRLNPRSLQAHVENRTVDQELKKTELGVKLSIQLPKRTPSSPPPWGLHLHLPLKGTPSWAWS